jgi:DNA repair photolyase
MLYKTGVEYGDYTMNHVVGCSHGCLYPCYAFLMAKRFGKVNTYEYWIEPCLVSNTLELLDKEIPKLKDKIETVHLCFTTDPFMCGYDEIKEMSLSAIEKLNDAGIKCTVLTKGILPAELSHYSKDNEYGITLITLDEEKRKQIEPNAADIKDRLAALRALHDKGCKTWVSIEPYPTPNIIEQDLTEILNEISFVDKIIFGRLNYNKEVRAYKGYKEFYNDAAGQVEYFCDELGMTCIIKKGTRTEEKEEK